MKNLIRIFGIFLFLMITNVSLSLGQQSMITGKVLDPSGQPASLVTVELYNKNNKVIASTLTDLEGNYTIKVPHMKYEVLKFQYLGFEDKTVNAHLPNPVVQMLSIYDNNTSEKAMVLESKVGTLK